MLEEPGSNYRPRLQERPQERLPAPPTRAEDAAPLPAAESRPAAAPGRLSALPRRPLWVTLTAYYLCLTALLRLCSLAQLESVGAVVGYLASSVTLGVIALGLLGMRRWGAWLLLAYCLWTVLSALGVGLYRISVMVQQVERTFVRDQLVFQEILFHMALNFFFFGLLGLWYFIQRDRFLPLQGPWTTRSNVVSLLLLGSLLLYSASQVSNAPNEIRLREQELIRSQSSVQDFMTDMFGE